MTAVIRAGSPKQAPLEESIQIEQPKEDKPLDAPAHPRIWGIEIRFLVLPLLTAQNASAVLLMRAVRSLPGQTDFSTQTAVIMQEVFKVIACVIIMMSTEGTLAQAWDKPREALKTSIPAMLYFFQNNVQYVAVSLLDATTYTVSYQSKTFWSAFLTLLILGRRLPCSKWTAITFLSGGIIMVNLAGSNKTEARAENEVTAPERIMGLMLINAAAIASSLAGVYFEKILKEVKVTLWTRNLQLAFYSIITGFITLQLSTKDKLIVEKGFFYGYTPATWICIAANAFGGLLCGAVIKYADAVSKDVSIGASIVLSTLGSVIFFEYAVTLQVIVGIICVIYSVFIYSGNARSPFEACVN